MPPESSASADLHLHSDRSDGTETPATVVRQARLAGLATIALTDHDTTRGWDEASQAALREGIALLPGAEISSKHRGFSVHVLAYLFDPTHPELTRLMARVRDDRIGRAEQFVENLAREYPLTWDDVIAQRADDATIGRPHIADALVAGGFATSREDAFRGPLNPAGRHYVGHYAPDPLEVVRLIVRAGGVAVIAHPAGRGMMPDRMIRALLAEGLAGFELGHRENVRSGVMHLRSFVEAHDLIVTGSSDYHGAGKPNRLGEHTTAPVMVDRIIAGASGSAPILG
ncbi:PHP domain-containing protein [Microbacterium sp. G2-8]|uniref:PHP domain-containing protein n=1 Tax=Microbacterium sp. G2-8 TaxID=2842454 RepID=UPI001C8ADCD9|nr:PHP domain-containing protein [Microbacterium sp. G2-8]